MASMDSWERHRQRPSHRRDHNPSFSSTLLDTIYRSIDNDDMAEKKLPVRRRSAAEFDRKSRTTLLNSSSSGSSDSGSTAWFSSSESSSFSHKPAKPKPKPGREGYDGQEPNRKPEREFGGGFVKTKPRGLKGIYGDIKKVKQPVSPGGRLASFLNSIFASAKKAKTDSSTCSSASSFSRSCLSKTPASSSTSSRGQNAKRSVRFCPVSVIVGEDCRPCGHKDLHGDTSGPGHVRSRRVSEEKRRVHEAARDLLKTYRHVQNETLGFLDDDDDDDDASCASSDLFELDNLSTIGEELPVYETTHLGMNRAIANGLMV